LPAYPDLTLRRLGIVLLDRPGPGSYFGVVRVSINFFSAPEPPMNRSSALLVAAALLAGCAETDTPMAPSDPRAVNAAITHNRQRMIVIEDAVVPNPCTGEDVLLHIDQLFVLHEFAVEGKLFHGHFTFLDRGTRGVGLTTGVTYRQVGAEQDFLHLKGEVGGQERFHNTINLISQGPMPNIVVVEVFRIMVSPSGEVKLQFDKLKQVCTG
jgi:hypothetical protein